MIIIIIITTVLVVVLAIGGVHDHDDDFFYIVMVLICSGGGRWREGEQIASIELFFCFSLRISLNFCHKILLIPTIQEILKFPPLRRNTNDD